MSALYLKPKRSRTCLLSLGVVHGVFAVVLCSSTQGLTRWLWLLAALLSLAISAYQWHRTKAFEWCLNVDGTAKMRLNGQQWLQVTPKGAQMLNRWVLIAHWQDANNQRFQSVWWADSLTSKEFKMAYVWLRWQTWPHEKDKQ